MANTGSHPSFFAEEMYYHVRDEQHYAPDNNYDAFASYHSDTAVTFRPLLPTTVASPPISMPPFVPVKAEGTSSLPRPGVLAGHVDNSQFLPITDELWDSASIDYDADASSPGSDDTINSPSTPNTELVSSFTEIFFQQGHGGNVVAADFAAKRAADNLSIAPLYPAAAPNPASWPQFPHSAAAMQPSSPTTAISPNAVMPAPVIPTQDQHFAQEPSQFARFLHQENELFDSGLSTRNALVEELPDAPAPKDENVSDTEDTCSSRSNSSMDSAARHKWEDDLLLREWKKGTPYRRIKAIGNFKVAESTLRGRIRTLTKDKSERVRRPEWTAEDEALLRQAVAHYSRELPLRARASRKLPWLKIAKWIKENGGSYQFASAACSKKWDNMNVR
ncbi:hypothetical protein KC343_g13636 [Hortaea werneckii]|uniref:Myb-like domain-containing protein n=1 Tax=Hortaea werneckii TaxID=91943 RepID=A0A3M7BV78_HORWE|nr:hypothetical protein KC323_g8050 [Hortaea werneckii]KAI6867785.1 hypothetical protein KC338_g4225 [Hortaea werneckii]KAI7172168.1 hypothetical protein KC352_g24780 [Hortaea werneckii]KAI7346282.1 hypothetical protein KC320_g7959 [Hortaea werneckii]KAI7552218.1 hypothetical protein KC317_g13806 [Hortaea werneckii]